MRFLCCSFWDLVLSLLPVASMYLLLAGNWLVLARHFSSLFSTEGQNPFEMRYARLRHIEVVTLVCFWLRCLYIVFLEQRAWLKLLVT